MTCQFIHRGSARAHLPPPFTPNMTTGRHPLMRNHPSPSQPLSLRPPLLALLALLGVVCVVCVPNVHAQERGPKAGQARPSAIEGPLAVVLADSESSPLGERDKLATALLQALEQEGFSPLSHAQERLESHHSKPAQHLPKDVMQKLRESIDGVTRDLAMGDLPSAVTGMQAIDELHHSALVRLNRESKQARRLFTACVAMGVMLDDTGKSEEGVKRLHHCAVTFPGFRLSRDAFSPDAIALYQEVLQSIDPVVLRVDNLSPEMACTVRYNGLNVGAAPAQLRVHRGEATVQLECDDTPGRVHTVELANERQRLAINPKLEQAISATPQALRLRYDSPETLHTAAAAHTLALASTLNAAHAVLVHGLPTGGRRILLLQASQKENTERKGASNDPVLASVAWDGRLPSLPETVRRLVERNNRRQRNASPGNAHALRLDGANREAPGVNGDVSTTLSGMPSAAQWAWPVVGLAYGTSIGITLHNLHKRAQAREYIVAVQSLSSRNALADAFRTTEPGYVKRRNVSLAAASVSNALFVASSTLILPDSASTPWWAYASGGVGLVLAGTGAVMLGINSGCELGEQCTYSGSWDRDGSLPALLLIHAAGPLSVPLTYLINQALPGSVRRNQAPIQARIEADLNSAALHLQGTF